MKIALLAALLLVALWIVARRKPEDIPAKWMEEDAYDAWIIKVYGE